MKSNIFKCLGLVAVVMLMLCSCDYMQDLHDDEKDTEKEYDYHQMYIEHNAGDLTDKELAGFNEAARVYELYIEDCDTDYDKVKAAHDYLIKNCVYNKKAIDNDSLTEDDFTVYGALVKGTAVCEGYAKAFEMFMDIAQVDCITVTGTAGSDNVAHAWNMVKLDNDWYHVDVTFDDPYPELDEIIYLYFNVTDQIISKDHWWNRNMTPQADSDTYDYIKKQGNMLYDENELENYVTKKSNEKIMNFSFIWAGEKTISDEMWKNCIKDTEIVNLNYTYLGVDGRRLYIIYLTY